MCIDTAIGPSPVEGYNLYLLNPARNRVHFWGIFEELSGNQRPWAAEVIEGIFGDFTIDALNTT